VRIGGPSLPYDPTYHLLWRIDKIRALVKRERPDVLEIHSPYAAAASALSCSRAWFGVRTFTWHSDFIDTYLRVMLERSLPSPAASALLSPLWSMVRSIGRGCDATFVAARWQKEKLASHGVPRLTHVPFGIERSAFTPAARSDARRRELLGEARARSGDDVKLLVGIGRFAVEKRWDVVLDAFILLRETHDAVLVLIGDGPERARMEARVAGRDDVRILGFERDRNRLASALASADALVHGCPYETFGLSIAEAMSAGLPVVVPNEGGAAELADPSTAETYASLDPRACADAIRRLLARDRDSLRRAAVSAAERIPNVRDQFATLCREYQRLLDEG
jgi:alpha-1,6-mannosyltransferase